MKGKMLAGIVLAVGAASAHAAATPDGADAAARLFGARPLVEDVSISPDGQWLAIVEPNGARGSAFYVVKLDGDRTPKGILTSEGGQDQLGNCHWATDSRIVCSIYAITGKRNDTLGFVRVISIASDGSDHKMLTHSTNERSLGVAQYGGGVIDWLADDEGGSVLMEQAHVPEKTIGTLLANTREGMGGHADRRHLVETVGDRAA